MIKSALAAIIRLGDDDFNELRNNWTREVRALLPNWTDYGHDEFSEISTDHGHMV